MEIQRIVHSYLPEDKKKKRSGASIRSEMVRVSFATEVSSHRNGISRPVQEAFNFQRRWDSM